MNRRSFLGSLLGAIPGLAMFRKLPTPRPPRLPESPWAKMCNKTIANYIKDEEAAASRHRKLMKLLREKGCVRINFNAGVIQDWKVRNS